MAISGGYAGQLFGYLMGFGVSMLKTTLIKGPQEFNLFSMKEINQNILSLLVIGCTLLVLVSTMLYGIFNRYNMKKGFSYYLFFVYGSFMTLSIAYAIFKA